jgi:anti-anti-sigma regulatory factor
MAIQNLSEDILLVELPSEGSKIAEELKTVSEKLSNECIYDVIIDFYKVELLNSWNISNLLALQSLLKDSGRQLVLCNVRIVTKCIFTVAGLRKEFVFADDKKTAMTALQSSDSPAG